MSRPLPSRASRSATSATVLRVDFSTGSVIERFVADGAPREVMLSQLLADSEEMRSLAVEALPQCDNPLLRLNHRNLVSLCRTLIATYGDMRLTMQREGITRIVPVSKQRGRQREA